MAYYNYYRQHNPSTWGTRGYEPDSPPAPRYQPQPQWRGADYYRAHNDGIQDSSAFDYVWGRFKSRTTGTISRREAQSWHRRVYGGLTDVATMMPSEIGAAAGYEAWRFFEHHRGIYRQPLMDDRERESEALVGLAVGEGEKLWAYTQRRSDKYGKREALETAAAVAMKLYTKGSFPASTRYDRPVQDPYLMPDSRYPREAQPRHRRSSSAAPLDYDDRRGYASGGDYSDDGRDMYGSPTLSSSYRHASPSIPAGLPVPDSYSRRRAISSAHHRPAIPSMYGGSALSTSPRHGALVIPPPGGGHHHSSSFGGYANPDVPVRTIRQGDPLSPYGHLPPGTYMVSGGSSSKRKHRKSHSGGVRYAM